MKVGGYKLSALEIEAVLLEVCFSSFPLSVGRIYRLRPTFLVICSRLEICHFKFYQLYLHSIQLFRSVVCWDCLTKHMGKL